MEASTPPKVTQSIVGISIQIWKNKQCANRAITALQDAARQCSYIADGTINPDHYIGRIESLVTAIADRYID